MDDSGRSEWVYTATIHKRTFRLERPTTLSSVLSEAASSAGSLVGFYSVLVRKGFARRKQKSFAVAYTGRGWWLACWCQMLRFTCTNRQRVLFLIMAAIARKHSLG